MSKDRAVLALVGSRQGCGHPSGVAPHRSALCAPAAPPFQATWVSAALSCPSLSFSVLPCFSCPLPQLHLTQSHDKPSPGNRAGRLHNNLQLAWKPREQRDAAVGAAGCVARSLVLPTEIVHITVQKMFVLAASKFYPDFYLSSFSL